MIYASRWDFKLSLMWQCKPVLSRVRRIDLRAQINSFSGSALSSYPAKVYLLLHRLVTDSDNLANFGYCTRTTAQSRLAEAQRLFEQGLITEDEYGRKREEIVIKAGASLFMPTRMLVIEENADLHK